MYVECGEKSQTADEFLKLRIANKLKDAGEAAAALEAKSATVKKRLKARKPPPAPVPPPPAPPVKDAAGQLPRSKKRKTVEPPAAPPPPVRPPGAPDPNSYVGRRLAKHFEVDGVKGAKELLLFFGKVTAYFASDSWFRVVYDDNDTEDLFEEELLEFFALYDKVQDQDRLRGT
jgi:hypothetical protein